MIVSRVILIFGMPLMPRFKLHPPNVAHTLAAWQRYISTGRDYVRGQAVSGSQDERLLDPFIGRWTEYSCHGFKDFLEASGLPKDQQVVLLSSKMELVYSRRNTQWQIESSFQNSPDRTTYTFKIGEHFQVQLSMGPLMNCKVTQDGALWLEEYESVTKPRVVMKVTNEVNGDKLTSVTKLKDAVVTRTFARQ